MSLSAEIAALTLLELSGIGVSPYSARGLSQTLDPIAAASQLRRTVNGNLKDLSAPQFRKYVSAISCNDQNAPALDGVWPGLELTVDCVATLSFKTGGTPQRPVVPGSLRTEGEFTIYRPRLLMKVVSYSEQEDEWGAVISWTLNLEEV